MGASLSQLQVSPITCQCIDSQGNRTTPLPDLPGHQPQQRHQTPPRGTRRSQLLVRGECRSWVTINGTRGLKDSSAKNWSGGYQQCCTNWYVYLQLNLQGLKNLLLDPNLLNGPVKGIVSYLKSRHKRSVPYYHMKMMIVGAAERGKTTLLHHLIQATTASSSKTNVATMGVNVKQWSYPHKMPGGNMVTYHINCWDFAGQEEFYSTHQCFLSQRSLYVVCTYGSIAHKELEPHNSISLSTWYVQFLCENNWCALLFSVSIVLVCYHTCNKQTVFQCKFHVVLLSNLENKLTSVCTYGCINMLIWV